MSSSPFGQALDIPRPLQEMGVRDFAVSTDGTDRAVKILTAWKVSTILMAESDISEFFGLYDELTETDIQAVERFIYAMVAEMFLRSWPEHMNILSVMGAMKQLMAGRYQEWLANELTADLLSLAGTARYESRSVADFSAISEQAERENRVSPRLSVGRHYETEPDSKLVQFFGPNEDMARYMATVVALQGSEVLRYELTISKSGFEEIVKVTMLWLSSDGRRREEAAEKALASRIVRALMEYAVTRIACRPKNQPRNDRQPVGLDKEVGRRIHRMGYRILPEDVLDSLGTTDREGISQMLDLLYTRISKEAKYREQILS